MVAIKWGPFSEARGGIQGGVTLCFFPLTIWGLVYTQDISTSIQIHPFINPSLHLSSKYHLCVSTCQVCARPWECKQKEVRGSQSHEGTRHTNLTLWSDFHSDGDMYRNYGCPSAPGSRHYLYCDFSSHKCWMVIFPDWAQAENRVRLGLRGGGAWSPGVAWLVPEKSVL